MKFAKLFTAVCVILSGWASLQAQCTGCTPNTVLCNGTNGPCPPTLDTATVGTAYTDTLTFNLPRQVDASQQSGGILGMVDFVQFKINSISGLPLGLSWSCDAGNCTYAPSSFPNGTFACIRICGTPLSAPGTYQVTINTTGTVSTPFGNQSGNEIFNLNLEILPAAAGGNSYFSFTPAQGCSPLVANFQSNAPQASFTPNTYNTGISYSWDFGNGDTSTQHTPPQITYNNAGTYYINYQEVVDTLPFTLQSVTVHAVNCSDIPILGVDNPDLYIKIMDGNGQTVHNTSGSQVAFGGTQHTWNVSLNLINQPYNIEIWDGDGGLLYGADDNCYDNSEGPFPYTMLTMPAANQYNTPITFTFNQNGLHFTWTVQKLAFIKQATDSVVVLPAPPTPLLSLMPGNQSCERDSILLEVYPGFIYEWLMNDSVVATGTNHQFYAKQNGNYKVRVFDPQSGCFSVSSDTALTFLPAPPPGFPQVGISYSSGQLQTPLTGNYTFQWIMLQGGQWVPIPAPLGVLVPYTPLEEGTYALIATNQYGCSDTSNTINVNNLGLGEQTTEIHLYPNPSSGTFTLEIPGNAPGEYFLEIVDITGKRIESFRFEGGNQSQWNFHTYAENGLYLLHTKGPGIQSIRRLQIQR